MLATRLKQWILLAGLGVAIMTSVLDAHHSIAGVYDSSQQRTLEGVVSQFQFINPHPFLIIEVKQGSGNAQTWKLEMDNRSELSEIGMTRDTFKTGDRVIVSGSLARAQAQSLYILKLERPSDGFQYEQVGNSPRIRTRTGGSK
jgi:hypothetical protein